MTRAERLLQLLQILRRHRRPVSSRLLAAELGVTPRTIYRDVQTLILQGAAIEGEAGLGYILRPGFVLPPLMFTEVEIEALVMGSHWVAQCADGPLARAARDALAKIAAVTPRDVHEIFDASGLLVGPSNTLAGEVSDRPPLSLTQVRDAIRAETRVKIAYVDAQGVSSDRTIWPIALVFFERSRVLAAWCERRDAFRHFRLDRIAHWRSLPDRYPRRRRALIREWREIEGVPTPS